MVYTITEQIHEEHSRFTNKKRDGTNMIVGAIDKNSNIIKNASDPIMSQPRTI